MMDDEKRPAGGIPEQSEDRGSGYLKINDVHRRIGRIYGEGYFKHQAEAVETNREDSFTTTEEDLMKYTARPIGQIIGFGLAALVGMSAWFWMRPLNDALGDPLGVYVGWVTFCTFLAGAYCLFMAWPKYRPRGMTDEEYDQRVASREEFRRKFRR